MEILKQRILTDGRVLEGNILKIDNFLNHQMDIKLLDEIGKAFRERFSGVEVDKILTIEASGIAVAVMTACHFNYVPVVFAKKTQSMNQDSNVYQSEVFSYTKQRGYKICVARDYIKTEEKVLIIDDFLAYGNAAVGLLDIVKQANAKPVGLGIVVEKGFQQGRQRLVASDVRIESLAILKSIKEDQIEFSN